LSYEENGESLYSLEVFIDEKKSVSRNNLQDAKHVLAVKDHRNISDKGYKDLSYFVNAIHHVSIIEKLRKCLNALCVTTFDVQSNDKATFCSLKKYIEYLAIGKGLDRSMK